LLGVGSVVNENSNATYHIINIKDSFWRARIARIYFFLLLRHADLKSK